MQQRNPHVLQRLEGRLMRSSPEEFGVFFRPEIEKWAKVIKATGIKLE